MTRGGALGFAFAKRRCIIYSSVTYGATFSHKRRLADAMLSTTVLYKSKNYAFYQSTVGVTHKLAFSCERRCRVKRGGWVDYGKDYRKIKSYHSAHSLNQVRTFRLPHLLPSTASLAACSLGLPPPSAGRLLLDYRQMMVERAMSTKNFTRSKVFWCNLVKYLCHRAQNIQISYYNERVWLSALPTFFKKGSENNFKKFQF